MGWLLALITGFRFLVGHISLRSSYPKPLSREEEKAEIEKYFSGDEKAKEKLIVHNMRLVAHIAKKYVSNGYDIDDLISIGTIGLIKAVNSYQRGKSTYLATYASRCIENEILMHLRSTKKQKNEVSLSEPIGTDKEGNDITLIDILASNELDVIDDVDTKMQVTEMLNKMDKLLDEREKKILILRYGIGGGTPLAQREVADKLGISRSYVSRLEKAAIAKIRE